MAKFPVAAAYIVLSFAVITGMAYDEGSRHRAFFPTVTALTANNLFHVALANGFFASLYLWCWIVSRTFLGKLNQQERVRVTEKFFVYFIDTALGLGVFRMSLNYWTVVQVTGVMAFRLLHQLAVARLESLEQAVQHTLVGSARFMTFLCFLFFTDVLLTVYFFDVAWRDGFGLPLLLGLESLVMGVTAVGVTIKFALMQYEQFRGGIWEPRGTYRFYCDIATEAISCVLYIGFVIIMAQHTTAPIHLIRHLMDNASRLIRAVRDCITYRKLCQRLERLGDPTDEQLEADRSCSVCLGDIDSPHGAKRLPCGHSFHSQCLTRWLERNNTCPYCRQELETMLAREADRLAEAERQANIAAARAHAAGAGAVVDAAPGDVDPLDVLQDEQAIRRVYEQYLQLHRVGQRADQPAAENAAANARAEAPVEAAQATPAAAPMPEAAGAAAEPPRAAPAASPMAPTGTVSTRESPLRVVTSVNGALASAAAGRAVSKLEAFERYREAVRQAEERLQADLAHLDGQQAAA